MEVFGAIAAAVNCAEAGIRVCDGLARLIQETKYAETSAKYLQDKVDSLHDMLLDLEATLKTVGGTCTSGEANRIHTKLVKSLECCRDTLTAFEADLEGLHGGQKLEILKKLLLARKLNKLDPVLARFEGKIDTHWKSISILFQCLQTCAS